MISPTPLSPSLDDRDCLLVVANSETGRAWRDRLRRDYPALSVRVCNSYLSAIAEASRRPVRAALAHVDPLMVHLDDAVAGLREAIGPGAKLVLCCAPAQEPTARRMVGQAADEYVILPLDGTDLDQAIGYPRPSGTISGEPPTATMEELESLGELFEAIDARPTELLERLAGIVRVAVNAQGVTVIVEGAVATSGDVVVHPVLSSPLTGETGVIGQLTLGPRSGGAYTPNDADKLRHYASVAGKMLVASSKHRRLRTLALTDPCSGLANRRFLEAEFDRILDLARRDRFPVTVLIFDIDNFKDFNDRFGHNVGDQVIRTVGETFRSLCREQDIVARIGGDEFAVVFWDPDGPRSAGSEHPENAIAVLDRVRDALRSERFDLPQSSTEGSPSALPSDVATQSVSLTISGGLATFPWDATTREDLLLRADEALLSAKRAGKNRVFLIGDRASH